MEVKDLQREISESERLAERGKMILGLHEQLAAKTAELDAAKKDISDRDATIARLEMEAAVAANGRELDATFEVLA